MLIIWSGTLIMIGVIFIIAPPTFLPSLQKAHQTANLARSLFCLEPSSFYPSDLHYWATRVHCHIQDYTKIGRDRQFV